MKAFAGSTLLLIGSGMARSWDLISILDGVFLSGGKDLRIMDDDNQFLGLESAWRA